MLRNKRWTIINCCVTTTGKRISQIKQFTKLNEKERQLRTHANLPQLIKPWHNSATSHPTKTIKFQRQNFKQKQKQNKTKPYAHNSGNEIKTKPYEHHNGMAHYFFVCQTMTVRIGKQNQSHSESLLPLKARELACSQNCSPEFQTSESFMYIMYNFGPGN